VDGSSLQDLVDEVSRLLGAPTTLEDRSFHLLAYGSQPSTVDVVRQTSILQRESSGSTRAWFEQFGISSSEGPVRIPADEERGIGARLCLPARSGDVTQGYLWLLDEDGSASDDDLRRAMGLADRAGRLLARSARDQRAREDRLVDLYGDDRAAAASAAAGLLEAGLVRHGDGVVVVALRSVNGGDVEREPLALRAGTLPPSVLVAPVRGHTTLLVPVRHGASTEDAVLGVRGLLRALLIDFPGAVAGVGGPARDLADAHQSWAEARLAARVAASLPSRGPVAEWSALGAYRLLGVAPEPVLAAAVLDPSVRSLLEQPDAVLADTARCYLEHAGSVQATAAALSVHRQTLYYRLQRIERVTGLDLGRGEDRLRLHLGLLLGPVLGVETAPQ